MEPLVIMMDILSMIKKLGYMTDIHWGRRNNSDVHNKDCLNYIKWFCTQCINNNVDAVAFLGDWYENRNSINISTLNWSYEGASLLNELNIPIYFCVGNHDLFNKNSRDLHSLIHFKEFKNFILIEHPTLVEEIEGKVFLCPYLFHEEYEQLKSNPPDAKVWAGHFEFQGFVLTGTNTKMLSGPNPNEYSKPDYIFSGHFHKRQSYKNIHYIGNTFAMDMGDCDDFDRGCAIYDHVTKDLKYINWEDGPKYKKIKLSELLEHPQQINSNTYVKCIVDTAISYEDLMKLKQSYTSNNNLREFTPEEDSSINDSLTDTQFEVDPNEELMTTNDLVVKLIREIDNEQIDNQLLESIFINA